MSSGERDRRKADNALVLRLQMKEVVEDAERPRKPVSELNSMEKAVYDLTGEAPPATQPCEMEFVQDETYEQVMAALREANRLAEIGRHAVTEEQLAKLMELAERLVPASHDAPRWDLTFEEFIDTRRVSDDGLRRFRWAKKVCADSFGTKTVDEIKHKDVLTLLRNLSDQGKAAATQQYLRSTLKSFFDYCVQNDYCTRNPVAGIPTPRGPEREGNPLTVDECRRLLRVASQPQLKTLKDKSGRRRGSWEQTFPIPEWLFPALLISLHTGLRRSNVSSAEKGIRWQDIDLQEGRLTIDGSRMKNKRSLELPIHPELLDYLRSLPAGAPDELVVPNAPKDPKTAWTRVRDAAGLSDHVWKDMRTTFATRLTEADVPEPVVGALLGHSPRSRVTRRYAKAEWNTKVDAVRRLEPLLVETGDDS